MVLDEFVSKKIHESISLYTSLISDINICMLSKIRNLILHGVLAAMFSMSFHYIFPIMVFGNASTDLDIAKLQRLSFVFLFSCILYVALSKRSSSNTDSYLMGIANMSDILSKKNKCVSILNGLKQIHAGNTCPIESKKYHLKRKIVFVKDFLQSIMYINLCFLFEDLLSSLLDLRFNFNDIISNLFLVVSSYLTSFIINVVWYSSNKMMGESYHPKSHHWQCYKKKLTSKLQLEKENYALILVLEEIIESYKKSKSLDKQSYLLSEIVYNITSKKNMKLKASKAKHRQAVIYQHNSGNKVVA